MPEPKTLSQLIEEIREMLNDVEVDIEEGSNDEDQTSRMIQYCHHFLHFMRWEA